MNLLLLFGLFFGIPKITPASPLYFIKTTREFLQSRFVLGEEDTAYWKFTIASKRIEEAKTLNNHGLVSLANRQIAIAKKEQAEGVEMLKNLKDKTDINYLLGTQKTIGVELGIVGNN